MATYTTSIPTSSFVRNSNLQPQLYGSEGEILNNKIAAIKESEPMQQLLKQLESLNDERHSQLRAYLDSLFAEAVSTGETGFKTHVLDSAWQVWEKLKNHFSSIG